MAYLTNKHWGAVIGAALVIAVVLIGVGLTALAVLAAIGGFLVGKFLDGELDLEEIRARAQARARGEDRPAQSTAGPATYPPNGASAQSPVAGPPGASRRVR